jgi:hypothetical protein
MTLCMLESMPCSSVDTPEVLVSTIAMLNPDLRETRGKQHHLVPEQSLALSHSQGA